MKKVFLFIVFFLCLAFLIASKSSNIRSFRNFPLEKLYLEKAVYETDIEKMRDVEMDEAAQKEFAERQKNLAQIELEIFMKRYHVSTAAMVLLLLSFVGLLSVYLGRFLHGRSPTRDEVIESFDVDDDLPKELYVDEWEFQQKVEGGFKTKKEAIEWIKSDPLLKCDYCGSRLRSTLTGKRETVQLVTFYKKVPEGAKDLRVVLGSYWFANAADELKCPSCQRVIKR